jgi:hypothetical protein
MQFISRHVAGDRPDEDQIGLMHCSGPGALFLHFLSEKQQEGDPRLSELANNQALIGSCSQCATLATATRDHTDG